MSETGRKVGIPRRRHPKKIVSSPCQYLSTDLQSRFTGRYSRRLSAQTTRNTLHVANLPSHQARLHWCQKHMHWNLNMWRNVMFSDECRFCLRQLDRRVKDWRRRRERYADCCTNRVTSFGGGSVMVWGGIFFTGKMRLVIIGCDLNAEKYRDEILQPVAIPYLYNLGPKSILQDDNACAHRDVTSPRGVFTTVRLNNTEGIFPFHIRGMNWMFTVTIFIPAVAPLSVCVSLYVTSESHFLSTKYLSSRHQDQ
ncbi:hypothetical protein MHYP_G00013230 [Metynnis hypsauchen]